MAFSGSFSSAVATAVSETGKRWRRRVTQLLICSLLSLMLFGCVNRSSSVRLIELPDVPRNGEVRKLTSGRRGVINEVAPPAIFLDLNDLIENSNSQPQVTIAYPKADQIIEETTLQVKINLRGLSIYKDEKIGLGPHLQVILDNQPAQAIYDLNDPIEFSDLAPGSHTLRVLTVKPWGESFKRETAYAQTTFHVFAKTGENTPDPNQPLLTYSEPQGTYGAEPILLDFHLNNAPLHRIAASDPTITDWSIRCDVNGQSFVLDQWQPIYLKGFKPGQNWVQLTLIDEQGDPIDNAFNSTVRVITYDPQQRDTLAQLTRGELTLTKVGQIVVPDYEPPIEEEPIEEEPIEEPLIEEPPIEQPPIDESPIEQPPIDELPLEQPPAENPVELQEAVEAENEQLTTDSSSEGAFEEPDQQGTDSSQQLQSPESPSSNKFQDAIIEAVPEIEDTEKSQRREEDKTPEETVLEEAVSEETVLEETVSEETEQPLFDEGSPIAPLSGDNDNPTTNDESAVLPIPRQAETEAKSFAPEFLNYDDFEEEHASDNEIDLEKNTEQTRSELDKDSATEGQNTSDYGQSTVDTAPKIDEPDAPSIETTINAIDAPSQELQNAKALPDSDESASQTAPKTSPSVQDRLQTIWQRFNPSTSEPITPEPTTPELTTPDDQSPKELAPNQVDESSPQSSPISETTSEPTSEETSELTTRSPFKAEPATSERPTSTTQSETTETETTETETTSRSSGLGPLEETELRQPTEQTPPAADEIADKAEQFANETKEAITNFFSNSLKTIKNPAKTTQNNLP